MVTLALLAGSMMVPTPLLAQSAGGVEQSGAGSAPFSAAQAAPAAATQPASAVTAAQSAPTARPATPSAMPADHTAPAPARTAAADTSSQVARVVGQEFGSHDTDANGSLSQAEFASWMVALKKVSDPTATAQSPATRSWVDAAFAQADKDKSRTVTETELTGFLTQGRS